MSTTPGVEAAPSVLTLKCTDKTPFIIAHEFFDALPIHAFQSIRPRPLQTPTGNITISSSPIARSPSKLSSSEWRELVVSPSPPPSILNPPKVPNPEFQLTVSALPTPNSRLLPTLSPRYAALLPIPDATIEVCPAARTIAEHVARLIGGSEDSGATAPSSDAAAVARTASSSSSPTRRSTPPTKTHPSGAALIIDYGPTTTVPANTLRGIRSHRPCSPFSSPGRVDLSADVDFGALAESALAAHEAVEVHGPVEQAHWLASMGGRERSEALVAKAMTADDGAGKEVADRIQGGWRRLVNRGPDGMGRLYKVMAVVPASGGARRPVGFGGDVDA